MDYEIEMLFIAQGEALQRVRCVIKEEKRIGKLALAHKLDDDLMREWKRARQRSENAHRRFEAITNKIKAYQARIAS